MKKAVARARKMTVGDPSKCVQGPLVDKDQFDRVLKLIQAGVEYGLLLSILLLPQLIWFHTLINSIVMVLSWSLVESVMAPPAFLLSQLCLVMYVMISYSLQSEWRRVFIL